MKKTQVKTLLESMYDFCGTFDKLLKSQYKKSDIQKHGATFPQFCIVMYEQFMSEATELLAVRGSKKTNKK